MEPSWQIRQTQGQAHAVLAWWSSTAPFNAATVGQLSFNPCESVSRDFFINNPVSSLTKIDSLLNIQTHWLHKKTGYFGERCDINLRYKQNNPIQFKSLLPTGLGARLYYLVPWICTMGNSNYFGYSALHVWPINNLSTYSLNDNRSENATDAHKGL